MAKRKRRLSPGAAMSRPSSPPVRPGLVGPLRTVPSSIPRPPYARTGDPGRSTSDVVRSVEEIEAMRRAGSASAEILILAGQLVAPGVKTDTIDALVHEETIKRGGYPSPLNYRGFPKSVCTSVNEVICHGIPDSRPLREGDIINVDVTTYLDGVHGDTSCTFLVGEVDDLSRNLVIETHRSLLAAIATVKPGAPFNEIGKAIERNARKHRLGVVRDFIGHGVGTEFHSNLQIPHYYNPRLTRAMELGMSFTIEPMLTLGGIESVFWDDGWTALTSDRSRTAQFEHTMVVGEQGAEIMTVTSRGECAADMYD